MRILPKAVAFAAVVFTFLSAAVCATARAQNYPTHGITLVVPYPAGGGVDAMARVVAEKLTGALGQQVVVDNRAGGSGLVGTRAFIKSPPDGSGTPDRSPSIRASTPMPASIRARTSRRSG